MLGTCTGQLKLYNVFSGQEEASYNCHNSAITHLEPSRVSIQRPVLSFRSSHSLSPGIFWARLDAYIKNAPSGWPVMTVIKVLVIVTYSLTEFYNYFFFPR